MNDTYIPTYYSTDVDALSDQEITHYMGEITEALRILSSNITALKSALFMGTESA